MKNWPRFIVALGVLLLGASLVPYVTFPSERIGWQNYIGVYEPPGEVHIANNAFVPAITYVPAGTRVRWTNDDSIPHTVTSSPPGLFDSGPIQPGDRFEYIFDTPGTYDYICSLHPAMQGTVVVSDGPFQIFLPLLVR